MIPRSPTAFAKFLKTKSIKIIHVKVDKTQPFLTLIHSSFEIIIVWTIIKTIRTKTNYYKNKFYLNFLKSPISFQHEVTSNQNKKSICLCCKHVNKRCNVHHHEKQRESYFSWIILMCPFFFLAMTGYWELIGNDWPRH